MVVVITSYNRIYHNAQNSKSFYSILTFYSIRLNHVLYTYESIQGKREKSNVYVAVVEKKKNRAHSGLEGFSFQPKDGYCRKLAHLAVIQSI